MVSAEIISDNIRVAQKYGNATTVIPCAEAMMQTEDGVVCGRYTYCRLFLLYVGFCIVRESLLMICAGFGSV